ncbi:MAG: rhodanese-like domain-containing protein [Gammaproteobacteria bacterium]|nr:rhodanese-like domain-containing protein [Gammaproteobacteria bacterium]
MDINQLSEFTGNHALLVMALIGIIIMLLAGEIQQRIGGVKAIGPVDATRMLNHENAIMIDMRNDKDYKAGHIVNAVHLPECDESSVERLEKFRKRPLIVYCRSGQRSAGICNRLRKQGFEPVYNLKGGVLAWQNANLPLSRS